MTTTTKPFAPQTAFRPAWMPHGLPALQSFRRLAGQAWRHRSQGKLRAWRRGRAKLP